MLDEFLGGEARDAGHAGKGKAGFAWRGEGQVFGAADSEVLILFREVNE